METKTETTETPLETLDVFSWTGKCVVIRSPTEDDPRELAVHRIAARHKNQLVLETHGSSNYASCFIMCEQTGPRTIEVRHFRHRMELEMERLVRFGPFWWFIRRTFLELIGAEPTLAHRISTFALGQGIDPIPALKCLYPTVIWPANCGTVWCKKD
jgi:hypothetical protein